MSTQIFSTYATDENRVTASTLAVLQSLSLQRFQRLLGQLIEQPDLDLITIQNQVSRGEAGVPDAVISASFRISIETKIRRNAVKKDQLVKHLASVKASDASLSLLLVLTPDEREPAVIDALKSDAVVWASFTRLDQAINELLNDPKEVVSEREGFLLRELQAMFVSEGLLASDSDVVIVAARNAWKEYQRFSAYVCQADRSFQPVGRMAFYSHGQVYPLVPRILETFDNVEFSPKRHSGKLGKLVDDLLANSSRHPGQSYKVMLLSEPDSKDTVVLGAPVANDLVTDSGRTWAFTLSQRYVSLEQLKKAKTTSDLVNG